MDPVQFLKCILFFSLDRIIIYWNKLYYLRNLVGLPIWFVGPFQFFHSWTPPAVTSCFIHVACTIKVLSKTVISAPCPRNWTNINRIDFFSLFPLTY